jgi:multisubunit Na+/H+ antiporter MnhE subunit
LSKKLVELQKRVFDFIVFGVATAIVWGEVSFCRFLFFGRKPAWNRSIWLLGCYCLVWMIGICISNLDLLKRAFARPDVADIELSVAQDPSN